MLALACVCAMGLAQNGSILRPRMEIAEVETEVGEMVDTQLEVFYMDDETPRMYYLSLGNLGIGTDIVQIDFDPAFELFIPLGGTLEEAIAKMEEIKGYYARPRLSTAELTGCFSFAYPTGDPVTVTVTRRQLVFTKLLEFSLPTGSEGIVRATHISKSDFSSLLSSVKFYKKIHPSEP